MKKVHFRHRVIRLNRLVVSDFQYRNMFRVAERYSELNEFPDRHLDPMIVLPIGNGFYRIKNGHHRFIAYLAAGREWASCVVEVEK